MVFEDDRLDMLNCGKIDGHKFVTFSGGVSSVDTLHKGAFHVYSKVELVDECVSSYFLLIDSIQELIGVNRALIL